MEIPSSPNKFFLCNRQHSVQVAVVSAQPTRHVIEPSHRQRSQLVALFLLIMYGDWWIWNFVLMAKVSAHKRRRTGKKIGMLSQ
jgi:hypothetical protein